MPDFSVTAAGVVARAGATFENVTAGATVTAGQPVYQDFNDGYKYKPAITSSISEARVAGIALHAAADGQPLQIITKGDVYLGAAVTQGEIYVASATAGGIAPVGDLDNNQVTIIGVGLANGDLRLNIFASGATYPDVA